MNPRHRQVCSLLLLVIIVTFFLCAIAESQIDFSKNLGKLAEKPAEDACRSSISAKIHEDKQATAHFSYVEHERKDDGVLHVYGNGTYLQLVQTANFSFICDYNERTGSVLQASYEEITAELQTTYKIRRCERKIQDDIDRDHTGYLHEFKRVWTLPETVVVKARRGGKTFEVYGQAAAMTQGSDQVRYKFKCTFELDRPDRPLTTDYWAIESPVH